jgi:hypothetical protein
MPLDLQQGIKLPVLNSKIEMLQIGKTYGDQCFFLRSPLCKKYRTNEVNTVRNPHIADKKRRRNMDFCKK